ncbi:hypothetical protein CEUSTIGMA_g6405.t1 [Chlamydomonas eustigma]|uniref:Uncharacterized protein n=1 Tax=Chlamydomonas eustigma TaxID=1157962 RepID=A0A250X7C6_9CHLO|nr:hypothetical protein CEUSTIGMA_g6405.t1 [Chlamydomonas eustigma]|eukprot:GAX78965.1 hypothetical protein CEUSTIGMA_g6405.t1 [Chlamydomonas eustigma]
MLSTLKALTTCLSSEPNVRTEFRLPQESKSLESVKNPAPQIRSEHLTVEIADDDQLNIDKVSVHPKSRDSCERSTAVCLSEPQSPLSCDLFAPLPHLVCDTKSDVDLADSSYLRKPSVRRKSSLLTVQPCDSPGAHSKREGRIGGSSVSWDEMSIVEGRESMVNVEPKQALSRSSSQTGSRRRRNSLVTVVDMLKQVGPVEPTRQGGHSVKGKTRLASFVAGNQVAPSLGSVSIRSRILINDKVLSKEVEGFTSARDMGSGQGDRAALGRTRSMASFEMV